MTLCKKTDFDFAQSSNFVLVERSQNQHSYNIPPIPAKISPLSASSAAIARLWYNRK
ncbi:hypothetical protein [Nostoc sp.]|uniref:hypothetical protein n=1 Tax=Nostoc sp. TaxID=1180 RepID=UPI002FF50C44